VAVIESISITTKDLKRLSDAQESNYVSYRTLVPVVNPRIQLVSGKDVSKTYQNNHIASVESCMKGAKGKFYDQMKDLRMIRVILDDKKDEDNKFIVHLRALVWKVIQLKNNETNWYIDRIYNSEKWAMDAFNEHWKKWGKLRYNTRLGTLIAKIKKGDVSYADTDTFSTINLTTREIINMELDELIYPNKDMKVPTNWRFADKLQHVYD
jgi:hypothetical protein